MAWTRALGFASIVVLLPLVRTRGVSSRGLRQSLRPGAVLAPGDAVRFVVEPAGHRYLLVVSLDGAGKVSVYHPFDGAESAPLAATARVEVPGSIVLDRAPGPERIVAVFSDAPLSAAAVGQRLAAAAPGSGSGSQVKLALPGTEQISLVFEKKGEPQP